MEDHRRGPLSPRQRRKHALCVTENHVSLPGVSTSGHLLGENGIFLTTAQHSTRRMHVGLMTKYGSFTICRNCACALTGRVAGGDGIKARARRMLDINSEN